METNIALDIGGLKTSFTGSHVFIVFLNDQLRHQEPVLPALKLSEPSLRSLSAL